MSVETMWLLGLIVSLIFVIMSGMPVLLAIAGVPVLVGIVASVFGHFDLSYFSAFPQRVFGIMENSLLIAVPLFVMMGVLLERSKIAEKMLLMMAGFFGGSRSGLAYSVLIVSALIAASTGIIGATIVMLGMISLPALLKAGVSKQLSSGLICASGTLGQIIPPSIVLILLGDQISNAYIEAQQNLGNFAPDPVSVGDLFAGAILPGLLLVALYAVYIFVYGFFVDKQPITAQQIADITPTINVSFKQVCTVFLPPILLIIAVLGSILMGIATPTEAAGVGVAGTLLIAAINSENTTKKQRSIMLFGVFSAFGIAVIVSLKSAAPELSSARLLNVLTLVFSVVLILSLLLSAYQLIKDHILASALSQSVSVSGMVFAIIIAASMLSLVFRGFGGDEIVNELLSNIPGDRWGALLAVMIVIFLLGFILEFVEILFIVIPLVGPVLLAMDFNPVWLAILIAINLQTSFLTPPFGFALFYYRSVAPASITTVDIYKSVIPFIAIQLLAMAILVMYPQIATWLPEWINK